MVIEVTRKTRFWIWRWSWVLNLGLKKYVSRLTIGYDCEKTNRMIFVIQKPTSICRENTPRVEKLEKNKFRVLTKVFRIFDIRNFNLYNTFF